MAHHTKDDWTDDLRSQRTALSANATARTQGEVESDSCNNEMKDLNPRYTVLWMWSMTLMRATTAAYAETDYFEKGKVAGSGSSKNGMSPSVESSSALRL